MAEIHSQPHADIHVVSSEIGEEQALERLEQKIHRAIEAIRTLKSERDELRAELEQMQEQLRLQAEQQSANHAQGDEIKALIKQRDALLQERVATAHRVEAMLERLKSIGIV